MISAPKWMFLCLLTCFLSCSVSQGSEIVKYVKPGDDVTLQCQGPRDAAIEMLEWIKPDLKSDEYVFFVRGMQTYETYQHPDFHGRVELVDPEIKDGNFSVILKNVTIKDAGAYECHVAKSHSGRSKRETPQLISNVTLNVVSVNITADTGVNITLPCSTLSRSPIITVEWTMRNKKDYVFMYRDKRSVPDKQHPVYKNLVELKDSEMKDGDASLILKDVINNNSGIYECWISQGGRNLKTSIINLYIYPPGGGAGDTEDGGNNIKQIALSISLPVLVLVVVLVVCGYRIYKEPLKKLFTNPLLK